MSPPMMCDAAAQPESSSEKDKKSVFNLCTALQRKIKALVVRVQTVNL